MSEDYTPDGATFPPFPWSLVKDGEVYNFDSIQKSGDPKKGLFANLMDLGAYCYANLGAATSALSTLLGKQTAASGDTLIGVLTYTGRFLTLPTGTLRTVFQYVANNAITDGASTGITPSATTAVMDYAVSRDYHVFSPSASTLTITVKSTSPVPPEGAEINLSAYAVANTKFVNLVREDSSQIVIMEGLASGANFGSACLKNIGGTWRLKTATGLGSVWDPAAYPGSINNP